MKTVRALRLVVLLALTVAAPASAQLAPAWMLPAAAHSSGVNASFWQTDLSLHNPHTYDLPVVAQLLPSDSVNWSAPTLDITLAPWETLNLWDALGANGFDYSGTGAILLYAAPELACSDPASCDFLVSSRTYTPAPGSGEYAQAIPGFTVDQGIDWNTLGYATGILNDGAYFRTNIGVASWTAGWTTVRVDVQDAAGNILANEWLDVPPFGHVQRRMATSVEGGTLVFVLDDGPDDPLVYAYASMVDQSTNDPAFFLAQPSIVGVTAPKSAAASGFRPLPEANGARMTLPRRDLRSRR